MTLIEKTKKRLIRKKLVNRGDVLVVGVSGGADSVTLLYLLQALQHELGIQIHVAHFNHQLRRGANKDQVFVESLAKKFGLPFHTKSWKNPKSVEDLARKERFKFLTETAQKVNADAIVLAHHKDDLAETILMRILRGAGLQGLQGILSKKTLYGYTFIRPLLETSRFEIESFLKENNIPFRIDPTNKQPDFFRNKIRLKLLPLLEKEYSPNIKELLVNLGRNISTDYEYLDKQADAFFQNLVKNPSAKNSLQLDIKKLKKCPEAIERMVIRKAIAHLKGNTNRMALTHLDEISDLLDNRPVKSIVHLPGGIKVQKTSTSLIISK
ncbi:MAG: tRNA lysidine(34) synthetase TilS [Candidatus Omnitrophica bacterium]|nr:tRNA lysidine(34) synthetase TilS [Candidatus Omnitrophota bacterium]